MISLLLADDHPVILSGLSEMLAACPDLKVLGTETDGAQIVPRALELRPDVLVMDLSMPGQNGFEIIRLLKQECPATRVLVLSMHAAISYVWEALRCGALGYALKCAEGEHLMCAVREVALNRQYLCPPLSNHELQSYARQLDEPSLAPHDMLTRREREVLALVAQGCTSNEIATRLDIGTRTVETHRSNVLQKLGLRNQAELIRYAITRGILLPQ